MSAPPLEKSSPLPEASQDRGLRRELGFWSLTFIAFGGMIGSGWLFGAFYAAQAAGPAALLSWPLAGGALMLVGLVLVQLGATRPRAGGMVRWPKEASGPVVGTVVSWGILLAVSSALAAEASAIVQYAERYLPGLSEGGTLTDRGTAAAVGLLAVLVLGNWFGVRLFARINALLTVLKFGVPLLTVAALLLAGFEPGNIERGGGWAPYGWSAALSVIATAGIIYAMNGFAAPVELSAEARNARRDLPRAVITAIALAVVLYTVLQAVFLLAVPPGELVGGWHGLNFDSPYGQLAIMLNLGWLATVIYMDAVVSPAGAASVFVASGARETYATARNGLLPRYVAEIHPGSGVPRRAMCVNFLISVMFLAPFRGWQDIIAVVGVLSLLTYSTCAVAAGVFRETDRFTRPVVPRLGFVAPASFVVSTELIHWAGWHHLRVALPMVALGLVLHVVRRRREPDLPAQLRRGAWLAAYLLLLFVVSWGGAFGGAGVLPAPWDSVLVGAGGLALYFRAVRSSVGTPQGEVGDTDMAREG